MRLPNYSTAMNIGRVITRAFAKIAIFLPGLITLGGLQAVETTELRAVADTFITEGHDGSFPAEKYGQSKFIEIGTTNSGGALVTKFGLVRFDLGEIPEKAEIRSARLVLSRVYYDDAGATPGISPLISAHRIIRNWNETSMNGATWSSAKNNVSGGKWEVPGARGASDIAPAPTDFVNPFFNNPVQIFDLTQDVREIVSGRAANNGWILCGPEDASGRYFVRFLSRDQNTRSEQVPRLIINWQP